MSDDVVETGESKLLQRKATITGIADGVSGAFSTHAEREHKVKGAFSFNRNAPELDVCVERYFLEIKKFKTVHNMNNGEIANRCKRAAAWIIVTDDRALLEALFSIKNLPHRDDFVEMLYAHFTYSVCCALLEVGREKVPPDVERDFIHNLVKERGKTNIAWLALSMRSFADAYGDEPVAQP